MINFLFECLCGSTFPQPMTAATVAVPPRTTPEERDIIVKAAGKGGVKTVRFLHSAVAVVLAHGLDDAVQVRATAPTPRMRETVVVYRHGGKGVDVSVVSVVDGAVTVLSTVSDDSVGGTMFDDALVQFCCAEFKKKTRLDISGARSLMRLRAACEEARRSLSINLRVSIEVDSLFEGIDFATVITRPRFEDLCHALFRGCVKVCRGLGYCVRNGLWGSNDCFLFRLLQPIEAAMAEAEVTPSNIDRVLLAGGVSRMPRLKDTISALFPLSCSIETKTNPEETVASGAAVAACLQSKLMQLEEIESGAAAAGSKHGKGRGKPQKPVASDGEPAHVLGDTVALHHLSASVGAVHNSSCVHVAVHRLSLLPTTGNCMVTVPVVDKVATVTIVQGDDFENPAGNLALCTMPLPVLSLDEAVDVNVTIGVTKHGGVLVRAVLPDGTQSTVHIPHGHEHAPLAFDDFSPMGMSGPPVVAVTPAESVPEPEPVKTSPASIDPTPAPVTAPAPAVAIPPPVPAVKPIIAADDLD
jgi:hypothetical protein